jgi:hypothetical protein
LTLLKTRLARHFCRGYNQERFFAFKGLDHESLLTGVSSEREIMNFTKRRVSIGLWIVCGMIVLTGCQTIRDSNAKSTEEMLAAAGFQMRQAQTQDQLTNLQGLPQRKLIPHTRDGQVFYVYADDEVCQCVYVGTEKSYQDYQKMALQQNLADEQEMTAELNSETSLNWGAWGPWGPWRY